MIQQILFTVLVLLVALFAYRLYGRVLRNIRLGRAEVIRGNQTRRWRNVLLVALGQRKMFKRFIPAVMHLFIYLAFLITQVELIEIFVDGFSGGHRTLAHQLGGFYTFVISTIEVLSVLALVATVVFIIRRTVLKVKRFHNPEMTWWPTTDALLILGGEILLIGAILTMNSSDLALQAQSHPYYVETGAFAISSLIAPWLTGWSVDLLLFLERAGWWGHILVVFGFILYLPVSKHLHIFLAFITTWYSRLESRGRMENMPEIMNEVKSMLGLAPEAETSDAIPEFGAKDVFGLSWRTLMEAYTCTECGRCTAVCPANLTGKKLSPRKILMDIRDRMEVVGRTLDSTREMSASDYDDGVSLFDYITTEELYACTTCNACVEACPVLLNPLEPILAMRRYDILTNGKGPSDWLPMFTSLENNGTVWQMGVSREQWAEDFTQSQGDD